ncbi:hypothetical protein LCGC14_2429600 [marine sediment metagenome]|uniref:Uncharacterized protein n=1 Tax=marine sediment metagenome TaxID=412755 RepID=A0A0F9BMH1_9ZZZZ
MLAMQEKQTMNDLPAICPRCEGVMLPLQSDLYGKYRSCLSCGHYADLLLEPAIDTQPRRVGIRPKRLRGGAR